MDKTAPGWDNASAPSLDEIERLARAALDAFPDPFRAKVADVLVRVADFAAEDILKGLGIDNPFELSGLYVGVPLTEGSVTHPTLNRPEVWLYRRSILDEWCAREDVTLGELVAHVLIHELGHHFGWSDADMDAALAPDHPSDS